MNLTQNSGQYIWKGRWGAETVLGQQIQNSPRLINSSQTLNNPKLQNVNVSLRSNLE